MLGSRPTRSESKSPATPPIKPEPNQATASTRLHGHAERRRDLPIVGQRPHRGAELRVAEECLDAERDEDAEASPTIWVYVTSTPAKPMW